LRLRTVEDVRAVGAFVTARPMTGPDHTDAVGTRGTSSPPGWSSAGPPGCGPPATACSRAARRGGRTVGTARARGGGSGAERLGERRGSGVAPPV